ncbi:hypothetical protein LTR36_004152 [Oleoguttula mirabilis]|uniref:Lysine-specific metallo-endopeptidase domain-containing protein n=1 Tax=Oleoguttula mirabilis TaxID=1507867 RepID=A0AAV9JHW6_9PEZI|nr:hypothetical protein LTR36_004152 [Oleoguttula mirabilis]
MACVLSPALLLTVLLAVQATSSPIQLHKRNLNTPVIDPNGDFDDQDIQQLTDAFSDALELASYAVTDLDDDIFQKYFDEADQTTVLSVFDNILGNPADESSPIGNAKLTQITVTSDYIDDDFPNYVCDGATFAAIRNELADNPTIVICPSAFGHGGNGKSYGDESSNNFVDAITCEYFTQASTRVSWMMETLGAILLHEYTHFQSLVDPALADPTTDYEGENGDPESVGPYSARNLDHGLAVTNADSYTWMATENLWSVICKNEGPYDDPTEDDAVDSNCGDETCGYGDDDGTDID